MINGNDLYIAIGENEDAPFAWTKSNDIQTNAEKIPISSPTTGEWKEHIIGRCEWGFTVNWLFGNLADINNLLMVGKSYAITIYGRNGSTLTPLLKGTASCMTAKTNLTRGSIANGTFQHGAAP